MGCDEAIEVADRATDPLERGANLSRDESIGHFKG